MAIVNLVEETFEAQIKQPGIILLDFWASWCGPCRTFAPIFERASERHADVVFAKVNTDEQRNIAGAFRIQSIPTLMAFRDGVMLYSEPGVVPDAALDDLIGQIKALDMEEVKREAKPVSG